MFDGILDFLRMLSTPSFILNADGEMVGCNRSFNKDPLLFLHKFQLATKAADLMSNQQASVLQIELVQKKYLLSLVQLENEQCRCWLVSCLPDNEIGTISQASPVKNTANPLISTTAVPIKTALISADLVLHSDLPEFATGGNFSTQLQLLMQQYHLYDLEQRLTQALEISHTLKVMIGDQTYMFVQQKIADTDYLFVHQQQCAANEADISSLLLSFETLVGGIVIIDAEHNIRYLSQQIPVDFPYFKVHPVKTNSCELLARAVMHNSPDFDSHKVNVSLRWLRRQLRQHKTLHYSIQLRDGRTFQYRDYVQSNGSRVGLITDDTTARMLDQLLQIAAVQSQEANDLQFRLISTLSHEIRTPLNVIAGLVELAINDPVLGHHQYITTIDNTTRHLLQLLNNVLDLSKLESEQTQLQLLETDLRCLCEDILESFVAKAKFKGLTTEVYIDPAINGLYLCDGLRLRQVLENLLSNSLKFTSGKQGSVRLDVLCAATESNKQRISFHVIDNGMGISAEQQKHIFTSYAQATPDIYYRFGGTGLGLSISTYICRLMGSTLKVSSQLGIGSEFSFEIEFQRLSTINWQLPGHMHYQPVCCNSQQALNLLQRYQQKLPFNFVFSDAEQMLLPGLPLNQIRILDLADPAIKDKKQYLQHFEAQSGFGFVINSTLARHFKLESASPLEMQPFRLTEWLQSLQFLPQEEPIATASATVIQRPDVRILIVDDSNENLYVVQQQLAALGFTADIARNGETAFDLCRMKQYQLLITDYQLPGWNGAELARQLRQHELQNDVPASTVWVLTGNNSDSCLQECNLAAVDQVLIKPCSLALLKQQFEAFCAAIDDDIDLQQSYPDCIIDIDRELPVADGTLVNIETILLFIGPLTPLQLTRTLEQFRLYLGTQQALLNSANQQQNRILLKEIFHNIKSTARYYGSGTLSLLAEQHEQALTDPTQAELSDEELHRLNQLMDAVIGKFVELERQGVATTDEY